MYRSTAWNPSFGTSMSHPGAQQTNPPPTVPRINSVTLDMDIARVSRGMVAGLLAAAVALGIGQLVAGFVAPDASPVVAVGESSIGLTPPPVKSFAISAFGSHDKVVLVAGILAVLAIFAAAVGVLAMRRLAYGIAGLAVFTAVGIAAALTRPTADAGWAFPTLIGGVAAAGALRLVLPAAPKRRPPRPLRRPPRRPGHPGPGPASRDATGDVACVPARAPGPRIRARTQALPAHQRGRGGNGGRGWPGRAPAVRAFQRLAGAVVAAAAQARASRSPAARREQSADTGPELVYHPELLVLPGGHRDRAARGAAVGLAPADPRHGRAGDHDQLRRADPAPADRRLHHADLRLQP